MLDKNTRIILLDIVIILAIHGLYILKLTRIFKRYVINTFLARGTVAGLFSYMVMIFFVTFSHVVDIVYLATALDSLNVFPDPLTTFYYVSGMYTTVGSNYNPGIEWRSLSMLISFTGLFAFSISGSGLFTMLGYFLAADTEKALRKNSG